jgi:hypothetical protein
VSSVSDGGRARRRRVEGNIVAAVVGEVGRRELEGKISCCCPCSCAATAAVVSGLVSRGRGRERDLAPVKMSRNVVETRWCIVRW